MKKILCLLALSSALVSIHTSSFAAAADVLPVHSYANHHLADMRAMHPKTYVGYVDVPESQEARQGLYRQGFFDFMDSIHGQTDQTLWQQIHDEGRSIESPTEDQITALYMRAWLLSVDGNISERFNELLTDIQKLPVVRLMYRALDVNEAGVPHWKVSTDACLNTAPTETKPDDTKSAILRALKKYNFPQRSTIPMVGAGELGISTLVDMWLARALPLPMGIAYPAHGVNLNKAEAAIHDMIHLQLEDAENTIESMMKLSLSNYPEWGQSSYYWEALENILPHKIARYHSVMGILRNYRDHCQDVFIQAFKQATSEEEQTVARKRYDAAITPLFIALHETEALGEFTLNQDTLDAVFTSMKEQMNGPIEEEDNLQESLDLFDSLPAGASDEEIARIFMSQKKLTGYTNFSEAEQAMTLAEYLEVDNITYTLSTKRVGRNIKLRIEYAEGTKRFSFSINHPDIAIASVLDNLNLLRAGGVEMHELPPEYTREVLMAWVKEIDRLSSNMSDDFIKALGAFITGSDKEAYAKIVETERVAIEKTDALSKEANTLYQVFVAAQNELKAFEAREDYRAVYEPVERARNIYTEADPISVQKLKKYRKIYESLVHAFEATDLYKEHERLHKAVYQALEAHNNVGKVEVEAGSNQREVE